jgi:peptidoglycan/xylan/chitin deacetylase (PgdA/CDA1 family)
LPPARALLYAATLGVLVLSVRAALIGPPPLEVATLLFVAYMALVLAGVLRLDLRMFADALVRGPSGARGVALTFDDGPDPMSTPAVLDALDAAAAKATFFVIGKKAELHPDLVREIMRRGHRIGLHSYAHDRLFALRSAKHIRKDLERGIEALKLVTGERPELFRPPIGHTNPSIVRIADELDLTVVGWSVSANDGIARANADGVLARVRRGLRDGAIVLLHDAAERGGRVPAGVLALPRVLEAVHRAQLPVVPLSSFLDQESA